MGSSGNGNQGGDASDWHKADYQVVKDTRAMEIETKVDTFQDLGFALERDNLPDVIAADVAFNPFSPYSTGFEKGLAGVQAFVPGGLFLGTARALSMTDPNQLGPRSSTSSKGQAIGAPNRPSRPDQTRGTKSPSVSGTKPMASVRPSSAAKPQSRKSNRGILTGGSGAGSQDQKKTLLGN
jgi:hypothetical protein